MWLPALALLSGVLTGLASGGRLRWAARRSWRHVPLLVAGVACWVAGTRSSGSAATILAAAGILALAGFAVPNRLVGLGLAALGMVTNLIVMAVDGGMPVRPSAAAQAGLARAASVPGLRYDPRHHPQGPGDHLTVLDDRIPLSVLHSVVSVGDVLLAVGVAVTVHRALQYRSRYGRRSVLRGLA